MLNVAVKIAVTPLLIGGASLAGIVDAQRSLSGGSACWLKT